MKHIFMGAVAALALTVSGAASAQSNTQSNSNSASQSGSQASTTTINNGQNAFSTMGFSNQGGTNNAGQSANINGTFNGNGNTIGSSASGFNTTLGGSANDAFARFESNGTAYSQTSVTPFETTTTSNHSGFATGTVDNGGAFQASVQTFGQSNGGSAFSVRVDGGYTAYQNETGYANQASNYSNYQAAQSSFQDFSASNSNSNSASNSHSDESTN